MLPETVFSRLSNFRWPFQ